MSLYDKNGITIKRFDARNYIVEGVNLPLSYHSTLDKAVLKVAKHSADKKGGPLHVWLHEYDEVAFMVADHLRANPSHLEGEVTCDPSEENKCLVDPTTGFVEGSMEEEAYNTRGDR